MTSAKHKHPTNKDVVHLLQSVAAAYTLTGAIRFRIVAYQKAADAIEHMTSEVYDAYENEQLQSIEGIGPSIQQHLREYFEKPEGSYLEKQLRKVPSPVYELMRAPGIGPKKAYKIVKEFKLEDDKTVFEDVKKLAADGRIAELEGFGEKSEADIVNSINMYEEKGDDEDRMTLPVAMQLSDDITEYLQKNKHVHKIESLGSLRRKAPTIGDVDVVVTCDAEHQQDIVDYFTDYPKTKSIEAKGESKGSIIVTGGRRIDLRVVPAKQYGAMIQYFTGNKAHNIKLREFALKKGYSLNEFGIKEVKSGKMHEFDSEEEFYDFLGLDWIPPEIRGGTTEISKAKNHTLPDLVALDDIKGEFHVHSSFDIQTSHDLGADSIADMAKMAEKLNYEYVALSEHNPSQKTSPEKVTELLKAKADAIEKIKTSVHLFNSLEVDILPDGSLPLPDEAFKHLDMCVVSIHSAFRMPRDDMTKRILKALSYPKVKILGHPTGRLIGKREEIDADWQEIFNFAKRKKIALEINSWPERLDLPDNLIKLASDNGNMLAIGTDAHSADQMDGISFGVYAARRGWVQKNGIINTQPLAKVKKWITNS